MMTKELTQAEIKHMLTVHKLYKALKEDDINFDAIESMCFTMYKMGISPLTTIRKYLGKYDLGHIKVLFIDGDKQPLNTMPAGADKENPSILVFLKESGCGEIVAVKLKFYSPIKINNTRKYDYINFMSECVR